MADVKNRITFAFVNTKMQTTINIQIDRINVTASNEKKCLAGRTAIFNVDVILG